MKKPAWIIGSVVLGVVLLAGCSPVGSTTNTVSNAPSSNQVDGTGTSSNSTSSSQSNSSSSPVSNQTGSSSGNQDNGSSARTSAIALVKESMTLASQGKAIGIPFAVQENIGVVEGSWGKPDSQTAAGAGVYASYGGRAAAFGLNKGEQIFDVRSFSSKLKTITPADVLTVLGTPGETRYTSDSIIDMYPAGANYQLLFVFPKSSTGAVASTIDHVSVVWPQGTVNLMAATQPAPSIVIGHGSTGGGNKLAFTITNPPSGYRLVELEWLPSQGQRPVVNTGRQATANASRGSTITGFITSVSGKAYSFEYDASLRGETGTLRLIYQNTAGVAMIGTSAKATLQ